MLPNARRRLVDVYPHPSTVRSMRHKTAETLSGTWVVVGVGLDPLPMGADFTEAVTNLQRMAAMAVADFGDDNVWLSVDTARQQANIIFGHAPSISAVHLERRPSG